MRCEHLVEVVLRICLDAQVAGGSEKMVNCADQVEGSDLVSVAGKDAIDGEAANAEREHGVGLQEVPRRAAEGLVKPGDGQRVSAWTTQGDSPRLPAAPDSVLGGKPDRP